MNAVKSTLARLEDLCKIESKNMRETSDLPVPRLLPFQNTQTTPDTTHLGMKSSLLIVILIGTLLCKKNANEFRGISVIVLSKFRRNFGGNGVIFRPQAEPHENSNGGRKFANLTTKFRLELVRTETKIRKSNNEISVGARTY